MCNWEQRNLKWHHKAVPRCSMTQMLHLQMKPNKNCDGKLWWDVQSLRVIAPEFVLPVLHKPSIHGTIWDDWYTTNCKVEAPHIEAWDLPVQNRGCIPGRCTYSLAWYARKQNRLGLMLSLKRVLQDSRTNFKGMYLEYRPMFLKTNEVNEWTNETWVLLVSGVFNSNCIKTQWILNVLAETSLHEETFKNQTGISILGQIWIET